MSLPRALGFLRDVAATSAKALPSRVRHRIIPEGYDWTWAETRRVARSADGEVRALFAPANYARQGYYWARAARTLPGVAATNMCFLEASEVSRTSSDLMVPAEVARHSFAWARRQKQLLLGGEFTHVLIEACRSVLPSEFGGDLRREIDAYREAGVKVAMISHGSDVRVPSVHASLEPHSPFRVPSDETRVLEQKALANHALLDSLGLPEFVSTPDLLEFRPNATWLPTIADASLWSPGSGEVSGRELPVVLHVPGGAPHTKGTSSINSAMRKLESDGLIRYIEAGATPHSEMPALMQRADIVVNQVSMGLYSVVAIEAMLAGKIAVAQVWESVRAAMCERSGTEVPVVEASPDTLYGVVRGVVESPEEYRELATSGRAFAQEVHSDAAAARVLEPFLRGRNR